MGSRKKSNFFSGPATKAPLELIGHIVLGNFFRTSKKVIFPSGQALTPSPSSGRATQKKIAASLPKHFIL